MCPRQVRAGERAEPLITLEKRGTPGDKPMQIDSYESRISAAASGQVVGDHRRSPGNRLVEIRNQPATEAFFPVIFEFFPCYRNNNSLLFFSLQIRFKPVNTAQCAHYRPILDPKFRDFPCILPCYQGIVPGELFAYDCPHHHLINDLAVV